jgi:hypothetical protein
MVEVFRKNLNPNEWGTTLAYNMMINYAMEEYALGRDRAKEYATIVQLRLLKSVGQVPPPQPDIQTAKEDLEFKQKRGAVQEGKHRRTEETTSVDDILMAFRKKEREGGYAIVNREVVEEE